MRIARYPMTARTGGRFAKAQAGRR